MIVLGICRVWQEAGLVFADSLSAAGILTFDDDRRVHGWNQPAFRSPWSAALGYKTHFIFPGAFSDEKRWANEPAKSAVSSGRPSGSHKIEGIRRGVSPGRQVRQADRTTKAAR
jgi:hypothetical protein